MAKCSDTTTIEQYLQGLVSMLSVPEDSIKSVLIQCGLTTGIKVCCLDEKSLDLVTARFLVWCATMMPYSKNNSDDSDGGWKHTEGGYQMINDQQRWMLARAKGLYRKWSVPLPADFPSTGVKVINL